MKNSTTKESDKKIFSLKELTKNDRVHFIGLGGIGMSGLGKILQEAGYKISGSDLGKNSLTDYLEKQGAKVYTGHEGENISDDVALIVKSSAIKDTNPEMIKAKQKEIPVIHRSDLLNAIMSGLEKDKTPISIGVTGTHGKTTTTGMITTIFRELGLEPGFAIGGEIPQLKTNSAFGKGEYFVSELDESDGTIEIYNPSAIVVTNLEFEHADHYKGGFEQILDTFERFINKIHENSKIVINIDDTGILQILERLNKEKTDRFITYSLKSKTADYYAEPLEIAPNAKMQVYKKGELIGIAELGVPGLHNISNSLGAIAVSYEYCPDLPAIFSALSKFTGMKKRFQTLGYAKGARIIDDYAHHPTEIKATIATARQFANISNPKGRVVAVFQPHRYTRLANLWNDFLKAFDNADVIYVCDVYSAEEAPIENINSEEFAKQLENKNTMHIKGSMEDVAKEIVGRIGENDLVLTMGAGTITNLGRIILDLANEQTK